MASITAATGAMAAAKLQEGGLKPREGAFEMPRNMTLLNLRTAAAAAGREGAEGHPR